jgi:hypothetical protein
MWKIVILSDPTEVRFARDELRAPQLWQHRLLARLRQSLPDSARRRVRILPYLSQVGTGRVRRVITRVAVVVAGAGSRGLRRRTRDCELHKAAVVVASCGTCLGVVALSRNSPQLPVAPLRATSTPSPSPPPPSHAQLERRQLAAISVAALDPFPSAAGLGIDALELLDAALPVITMHTAHYDALSSGGASAGGLGYEHHPSFVVAILDEIAAAASSPARGALLRAALVGRDAAEYVALAAALGRNATHAAVTRRALRDAWGRWCTDEGHTPGSGAVHGGQPAASGEPDVGGGELAAFLHRVGAPVAALREEEEWETARRAAVTAAIAGASAPSLPAKRRERWSFGKPKDNAAAA